MKNYVDHYQEAERLLRESQSPDHNPNAKALLVARAQVHATLATLKHDH